MLTVALLHWHKCGILNCTVGGGGGLGLSFVTVGLLLNLHVPQMMVSSVS